MAMRFYDEEQIRKTIRILKPNNQLFEIRILGTDKKKVISGYFKDAETLLQAFDKVDLRNQNVYITLGNVKEELFSRKQSEHFLQGTNTTSDKEINGYEWLFVDLDPVRSAGISSSNEELTKAKEKAKKVYDYLKSLGFYDPVKALSGNGCHLLYRIRLANTPENVNLVSRCLTVLSTLFDDEYVKIDVTNSNPSRICKLHGTLAQKGSSTEDRPHRMSYIFSKDEDPETNDKMFLEKLANEIPLPEQEKKQQPIKTEFNLENWIVEHGLEISDVSASNMGTIYSLAHCPFDHNHADGDSKFIQYTSGAFIFKCHHNSCSGKGWEDVRRLLEPEYYERRDKANQDDARIEQGWKEHNRLKANIQYTEIEPPDEEPAEEMFLTPKMINELPDPDQEYIRTGYKIIDSRMRGLEKTKISVVTGLRGSGKSTWLSNIMLNAIQDGHTVICYSGELPKKSFIRWLYQQAAGKTKVKKSKRFDDYYYVDSNTQTQIAEWIGDKLWIYNNNYGNSFKRIASVLKKVITEHKADLIVIDNLMALDLTEINRYDKYEAQTQFVLELSNIAKLTNTHIVFVAHPKKAGAFLRLDDISGTGNLSNAVDNAFLVHRNNQDFKRLTAEMFKWKPDNEIYDSTNVVEIAKNREDGIQDLFIPLFFEKQTKRLMNSTDESIIYGWDTSDGFEKPTQEEQEEIDSWSF